MVLTYINRRPELNGQAGQKMVDRGELPVVEVTAGAKLKALRQQADLTVRAIAGFAEMSPSTYAYYENEYKAEYLPIGVVLTLQPILLNHGVPQAALLDLVNPGESHVAIAQANIAEIPVIDWESAGDPTKRRVDTEVAEYELAHLDRAGRRNSIALNILDNTMDRIAPAGSRIIVDLSDTELVNRLYYVVTIAGQTLFRQYRTDPERFEPDSISGKFDPIYTENLDTVVVGRVWRVATLI